MSKYIPKLAKELVELMTERGCECTYNHDEKKVEATKYNYTIRATLRFIKDRTPIIAADILSAKFTDYTQGYE